MPKQINFSIILSAYAVRLIISVLDTPLVYLGVHLLYKKYPALKEKG